LRLKWERSDKISDSMAEAAKIRKKLVKIRTKKMGAHTDVRRAFRGRLLRWYDSHRRELPWRESRDPYRVWLSEIMLQQTRVNAVVGHYRRFLELFPTVETLAASSLDSVLAAWSGLGYYRRARMLHLAAQEVVEKCGGQFPKSASELRELPGIGRYTAAAIASIVFDEPVAVVDGNVERVLDRFLGRTLNANEVWTQAEALLSQQRAGHFNQAMMELGATVCTPRAPQCQICPVSELCATRGERPSGKKLAKQTRREIGYALDLRKGRVLLVPRANDLTLMPGMWELPELTESWDGAKPAFTVRHSITTTSYVVRVSQQDVVKPRAGKRVPVARLTEIPLTGLARKILRTAKIF
jgi:A/G-specific adenine glycosylase